ncbi:MAG: hypothetical protein WCG80_15955 [Spirochaetales bacterium]
MAFMRSDANAPRNWTCPNCNKSSGDGHYGQPRVCEKCGKVMCDSCAPKNFQHNCDTGSSGNSNSSGGSTKTIHSGPSTGSVIAKGMFDIASAQLKGQADFLKGMVDSSKEKTKANKDELVGVSATQLSSDLDELQGQLNELVTRATTLKVGFLASAQDKSMKKAICEKLEFGIMKLGSAGKAAEATYFQSKLDALVAKK